jgi:hypothetical protein
MAAFGMVMTALFSDCRAQGQSSGGKRLTIHASVIEKILLNIAEWAGEF